MKSLPGEPQLGLDSFDSFTRLDAVLSSRHALTGGVIYFPRKITNATLSTFRPQETTPNFTQSGFSAGAVDRLILSAHVGARVDAGGAACSRSIRRPRAPLPMVYAPQTQSGNFFNRQERNVRSLQLVEALTFSKDLARASTCSRSASTCSIRGFDGDDYSQELEVRRLDGSLAERTHVLARS